MSQQAVITGGAGFIGTALARELLQTGYQVAVYDAEPGSVRAGTAVVGDVRDRERLCAVARNADVIFHLAGVLGTSYLVERAREAVEVNILGSLTVFEVAREVGARVVHVGLLPDWPTSYMITKKAATSFGVMYHHDLGVDVRTLELANVYGPRQRLGPYFKAVPAFIACALKGMQLSVFGAGFGVLDCVYVDDVARALRLFGECDRAAGAVVPFGSGTGVTVNNLATRIVQLCGSASEVVHVAMRAGEPDAAPPGEVRGVDLSAWQALVNWRPATTLDEGLARTIAWYRERAMIETNGHAATLGACVRGDDSVAEPDRPAPR